MNYHSTIFFFLGLDKIAIFAFFGTIMALLFTGGAILLFAGDL